ncbi:MAG: 3D domain-containing protein [Candidatus Yanofskybacteria bacterium]|nr:3D domain-containing protein [Candidatus Yanofskybacteria bacterium]
MIKRIILLGVLLTILALPNNTAHANTYMNAVSKAVDHIVDTHKDPADTKSDVVAEPEIKPVVPVKETGIEVKKKLWVTATAYSSTRWQTDDTPCITATGYNVCNKTENIIAVSRDLVRSLGYHRQVMLPSLYGSEIFLIEDTMNARFVNRIDVHHGSTKDAKDFGLKRNVELQVI